MEGHTGRDTQGGTQGHSRKAMYPGVTAGPPFFRVGEAGRDGAQRGGGGVGERRTACRPPSKWRSTGLLGRSRLQKGGGVAGKG
jgi:hypothetical protein